MIDAQAGVRSSRRKVAVIGGGFGGMMAAGELAHAGHAVTLFERSSALGGKVAGIRADGVALDSGPTLLTLPEVVRAGFRRLGAEDLLPRFLELDTHCAYHFPEGETFSAHRDLERMLASAVAFGPREGEGLRSFYAEAAAIYGAAGEPYLEAPLEGQVDYLLRVWRRGVSALLRGARMGTLAQLAERCFRSIPLRNFAGRFATYAGASPYEASAAFALIPHIERAFGVYHVEGGMVALSAALERSLERVGVEVRLGVDALWEQSRAELRVGSADDTQAFDTVVVNADPLRDLGRIDEPLALSGYVLQLAVDRRLSLPHHSVSFANDYAGEFRTLFDGAVPADVTLYVCHPAATEPTLAPPWQSGLFVMVNAPPLGPAASERDWTEIASRLRSTCFARLRALWPELEGASLRVLGERTPVDLARLGAPGGSIYGFLPHGRLGPFRRPRIRSAIPGVFYAGGGTHPGGGVPLVLLSGHFAAQLAAQHLART